MFPIQFDCNRTCPYFEKRVNGKFWCKFNDLLEYMGAEKAHSETRQVKTQMKNMEALKQAVKSLKGTILDGDTHRLFSGTVKGVGIKLPKWNYPLVLKEDGTLAYDDYNGRWGDKNDIKKLQQEYTLHAAIQGALQFGYMYEMNEDSVTIFHPDGGQLTVSKDGVLDVIGFQGGGCHDFSNQIASCIGDTLSQANKVEANMIKQQTKRE